MPTPHVPNVSTFDGVLDLFLLCIVMELGNLITPAAYRKEVQPDMHDLVSTIHARGLARDLVDWWENYYQFIDADGEESLTGSQFLDQLFLHQVQTLIVYKRLAEQEEVLCDEDECTAASFQTWLIKSLGERLGLTSAALSAWVAEHEGDWRSMSFGWPGPTYDVKPRASPDAFKAGKHCICCQDHYSVLILP